MKVKPHCDNKSSVYNIKCDDDFNMLNIIGILNDSIIDEKYKQRIKEQLCNVHFIDNKNTCISIDYILWIDQSKKEVLRIHDKYKAKNKHYYEFTLDISKA